MDYQIAKVQVNDQCGTNYKHKISIGTMGDTANIGHEVSSNCSSQTWKIDDYLRLLDTIEVCGYGSWDDVCRRMPGNCKIHVDVKRHFDSVFVNGDTNDTFLKAFSFQSLYGGDLISTKVQYYPVLNSCEDPPRPGKDVSGNVSNLRNNGTWINKLTGYLPARGEFLQEWNNLAETDLNFEFPVSAEADTLPNTCTDDLNELDVALKTCMVSIYNRKLRQRYRVKRLVKEYSLLHKVKVKKGLTRLLNQDDGGSWNLEFLYRFSQLMCAYDMDYLVQGFLHEFSLKSKILQLQQVRKAGVKMFDSVRVLATLMATRRENIAELGNEKFEDLISGRGYYNHGGGGSGKRVALPLDIVGLPGCDKLNDGERELCSLIRIIPTSYTEIKQILIDECSKADGLRLADARAVVKIDVNKTRKIYDYLVQQKSIWIPQI